MRIHAQLPLIPMTHGLVLHYFHRLTPHEVITLWRKNVYVYARVLGHFSCVWLFVIGSSVQGILQVRILEWVVIPGTLPNPGIKPVSPATPALQADSLLLSHQVSPVKKERLLPFQRRGNETSYLQGLQPHGEWLIDASSCRTSIATWTGILSGQNNNGNAKSNEPAGLWR